MAIGLTGFVQTHREEAWEETEPARVAAIRAGDVAAVRANLAERHANDEPLDDWDEWDDWYQDRSPMGWAVRGGSACSYA